MPKSYLIVMASTKKAVTQVIFPSAELLWWQRLRIQPSTSLKELYRSGV
jgi:hypothetical protein